jgi:exopolysaccharide biosynthesis polyprenyl glycosylphosphotransferase
MEPPPNTFTDPAQRQSPPDGGDESPVTLRKDSEFGASPDMISPQGPRHADLTSALAVDVDAAKRSVTTPTSGKSALWKARPQMRRSGFQAASSGGRLLAPTLDPVSRGLDLHSFDGRTWGRLRLLVDIIVLYLAACAAALGESTVRSQPATGWIAVSFPLVVLAMLYARRTPDTRLQASLLDTAMHVLGVVSLATMLIIGVASLVDVHPLQLALRLWLFTTVYLGLARAVMLSVRHSLTRNGALAVPTLIVGAGTVGTHLVKRLEDPSYGMRPVGFLDSNPLEQVSTAAGAVPILGGPDDLAEAIERTGARRVIIAFSSEPDHLLVAKTRECQRLGIDVSLVPRLYESINDRATLDHVGGLPLLTLRAIDPRGWQFAVKHAIDRGSALLALIVLSPLMLAAAIAVKLSSPGPVLFRQQRVGWDEQEFSLYKFRTMVDSPPPNSSFELVAGFAPGGVEGADRRTRVGRWLRASSIDELPQLFNVLRGEMSMIGPRPERPEYVRQFAAEVPGYINRHRVKCGITGWAQVHGLRGQTSIGDRIEWDNYYIQNWSLRLDLKIVALTLVEVLRLREGSKDREEST